MRISFKTARMFLSSKKSLSHFTHGTSKSIEQKRSKKPHNIYREKIPDPITHFDYYLRLI